MRSCSSTLHHLPGGAIQSRRRGTKKHQDSLLSNRPNSPGVSRSEAGQIYRMLQERAANPLKPATFCGNVLTVHLLAPRRRDLSQQQPTNSSLPATQPAPAPAPASPLPFSRPTCGWTHRRFLLPLALLLLSGAHPLPQPRVGGVVVFPVGVGQLRESCQRGFARGSSSLVRLLVLQPVQGIDCETAEKSGGWDQEGREGDGTAVRQRVRWAGGGIARRGSSSCPGMVANTAQTACVRGERERERGRGRAPK